MSLHGPPIAIFAYRRPDHVRRLLESLARNPEFATSPTFIYCDAARHHRDEAAVAATREVVRRHAPPTAEIVCRAVNYGLSRSIIDGVTGLCERFGTAIVLEDDLVVSPVLLAYFRRALEHYAADDEVMHVSAYVFPTARPLPEAFFYRVTSCWGWATWARAWKHFQANGLWLRRSIVHRGLVRRFDVDGAFPHLPMLDDQITGRNDSWAVRWYASVLLRGGLCLHPGRSLTVNEGFDSTGEHCGVSDVYATQVADEMPARFPERLAEDPQALELLREYFRSTVFGGGKPASPSRRWNRAVRQWLRRLPIRIKSECFGRRP